jgi:hypothetical protein
MDLTLNGFQHEIFWLGLFGPPQPVTIDDHIGHQVDVLDIVPNRPLILCIIQTDQKNSGA